MRGLQVQARIVMEPLLEVHPRREVRESAGGKRNFGRLPDRLVRDFSSEPREFAQPFRAADPVPWDLWWPAGRIGSAGGGWRAL